MLLNLPKINGVMTSTQFSTDHGRKLVYLDIAAVVDRTGQAQFWCNLFVAIGISLYVSTTLDLSE